MFSLELGDITSRLLELQIYSPELAMAMEHEVGIPQIAVPFLVERIESAFARIEAATDAEKNDAHQDLSLWLIRSYRFYLTRLARADSESLWCFRFPKSDGHSRH